jgi:signal transduction histidine kinase
MSVLEDAVGAADAGPAGRFATVVIAFCAIPVVGYIDGHSSAFIAFSIFYVIPISAVAWVARRRSVTLVAVAACGASGLAADLWSVHAPPAYAYVNLGCRVLLFAFVGLLIVRLREAIQREREISRLRRELMQRVAVEVRQPLSEIYAKVVDLGFDGGELSSPDLRTLVSELASASQRATGLVDALASEELEPAAHGEFAMTPRP